MFKDLFNLKKKRVGGEIFGFYIVYTIIGLTICGLIGGVSVALLGTTSHQEAVKIGRAAGSITVILYALVLGIYIIINKSIFKDFKAVILLVFSVALTYLLGGLVGFIPLAFLTAIEPTNQNPPENENPPDSENPSE